jgi:hypothetical protein
MRVILTLTVVLMLAAGCRATPSPPRSQAYLESLRQIDKASCRAKGGSIRDVCILQLPACVAPYSDGGRRCSDNSQCQGKCLAQLDHAPKLGERVNGRCELDDDPCGCKIEVIQGAVGDSACYD